MAASQVNNSALPQGFTVYQAAPGAQLQFIPAVGTQELDDMIHAYIPGPASIQEKRATVSIEFLKYTQTTGETFNFYPVLMAVESPAMTDSVSSSYASPMTPSWDFSRLSTAPSVASSRASAHSRQSRKPSSSASSRHPGDVSNLPGMKIMTRDGRDITDSASRGSKTKEQRDHAHLMRIIKACDSCRRKKTKCDPSHRRRGVSQAQAPAAAKVVKKTKTAQPQSAPPPPSIAGHDMGFPVLPQSELDWSLFPPMDEFAMPDMSPEAWDELLAQPQFTDPTTDFLLDQFLADGPLDFQSPQIYTPSTSFSCPPLSAATPSSLAASSFASTSASASGAASPDGQQTSPALPYLQRGEGGSTDYTDFNLYSPRSSFSEDEQMVSIEQPYASHKAGVNHAQSESPDSQAVAPSPWTGDTSQDMHGLMQEWADWSGSSVLSAHPDGNVGYNVTAIHDAADYSAGSNGLYAGSPGVENGLDQQSVEVWHERSAPGQQSGPQRTLQDAFAASLAGSDVMRRGVANADLIRAYESILKSGVLHEPDSQRSRVVESMDLQNVKRSPVRSSVHDQSPSSSMIRSNSSTNRTSSDIDAVERVTTSPDPAQTWHSRAMEDISRSRLAPTTSIAQPTDRALPSSTILSGPASASTESEHHNYFSMREIPREAALEGPYSMAQPTGLNEATLAESRSRSSSVASYLRASQSIYGSTSVECNVRDLAMPHTKVSLTPEATLLGVLAIVWAVGFAKYLPTLVLVLVMTLQLMPQKMLAESRILSLISDKFNYKSSNDVNCLEPRRLADLERHYRQSQADMKDGLSEHDNDHLWNVHAALADGQHLAPADVLCEASE